MPWPVWSTRFVSGVGPATGTYTVPSGSRIVLKQASFMNLNSPSSSGDIRVAGRYVYIHNFQAPYSSADWPTMVVAYSGETVQLGLSSTFVSGAISGFLFSTNALVAGELQVPTWGPYEPPPEQNEPPEWT